MMKDVEAMQSFVVQLLEPTCLLVCLQQDYGKPNDEKTFQFNLKGEGVTPMGDQTQVGGGMIFDCEVECHGHQCPPGETRVYERYGHCTTVNVDTTKGVWMICTVETYFSTGSVIMEVGPCIVPLL